MKSQIHAYEAVFGRNVEARRFVNFLISGGARKASNALCGGDTESTDSSYDSIKPDQDELNASFAEIETLLREYKTKRQFDTIRRLADELVEGFDGMWLDWIKKYKVGMGTSYGAPRIFSYIEHENLTLPKPEYVMRSTLLEACLEIFFLVRNVATPQQPNKNDYLPPPPKKYPLNVIQFAKQQINNDPFDEKYTKLQKQNINHLEREALKSRYIWALSKKGHHDGLVRTKIMNYALPPKDGPPNVTITLKKIMTDHLNDFLSLKYMGEGCSVNEFIQKIQYPFVNQFGQDALHFLKKALEQLNKSNHRSISDIIKNVISEYNQHRDSKELIPALTDYLQHKHIDVYNADVLSSFNDKTKQCLQQHKTNYYKQGEPSQESFEATVESMYNDCIKQNYPHVYTDHE